MKPPWDAEGLTAWLERQPEPWRGYIKMAYDLGYYEGGEDARNDPDPNVGADADAEDDDGPLSLTSIGRLKLSEP